MQKKPGISAALPAEYASHAAERAEGSSRLFKRTGVVLRRGNYHEGDMAVELFLKGSGTTWVYLPGASRGSVRFGGTVEPLVWGRYQLYQSRRRTYLKEVEVTEDFWELRKNPGAVKQAVRLGATFDKYLIPGYPYDDLLISFYWALSALARKVPAAVVNARFLWRWLLNWGIAPDLLRCVSCGRPLEGRAVPHEGAFFCTACGGGPVLEIDEFARYATSKSFIPGGNLSRLIKQAEVLSRLFIENLEENN